MLHDELQLIESKVVAPTVTVGSVEDFAVVTELRNAFRVFSNGSNIPLTP
jgi:hypothetical protein